ncbi:MAG TPA: hypothetical protein VNM67_22070 [Thermoanaerobaculia bacterium]|jgi:hypothetical protein|nr:hypothetical protein [Thermoanaerobaculia bacterium]
MTIRFFLMAAGLGQLALAVGSLAIPGLLNWREDTARLRPLTRQIFWTYAGYILSFHICFGLLSLLAPDWILDRTPLATAVCGFIAVYWATRLVLQFTWIDRSQAPSGAIFVAAEAALVTLFASLVLIYGAAFVSHLRAG